MLDIIEADPSIAELVEQCDGYCPCAIEQTEDTRCPCKEFRDQETPGPCHCGRYEKIAPVKTLTDTQKEVVRAFAESGMNRSEASRRLFRSTNAVYNHLTGIKQKTGLDPWDFFDLLKLLRLAGVADFVDVVRCKDCKNRQSSEFCECRPETDFCSDGERRDA